MAIVNVTNNAKYNGAAMIGELIRTLPPRFITIIPLSSCCGSAARVARRRHETVGFSRPSTFS